MYTETDTSETGRRLSYNGEKGPSRVPPSSELIIFWPHDQPAMLVLTTKVINYNSFLGNTIVL